MQPLPAAHPARLAAQLDLADALARSGAAGAAKEAERLRRQVASQLGGYDEQAPLRRRAAGRGPA